VLTKEQSSQLELHVYDELLKSASSRPDSVIALQEIWQNMPRKLQKEPRLIFTYANQSMHDSDKADELETLVYKSLKKSWDSQLAQLYGLIIRSEPNKQLSNAEKLSKQYAKQAIWLLTLGRLAVRCQLWGKARAYFEESLALEANRETFAEYGKLLEQMGDMAGAMRSYKDGLVNVVACA
jgi:HemY protein